MLFVKKYNIIDYLLRVNEIINFILGFEEKIEDKVIIKNIIRSISSKFNAKFSTIEEYKDLNTLTLDEMHVTLTTYEIRIGKGKIDDKEVIFKTSKSPQIKENSSEEDTSYFEEMNFI